MRFELRMAISCAGLFLSASSFASTDFPFAVTRSSDGKISKIKIRDLPGMIESNLLTDLRESLADAESKFAANLEDDEYSSEPLTDPDEKSAFGEAKAYLALGLAKKDVDDPRLDGEFTKARKKLDSLEVFRLVASPNDIGAFDKENAVEEAIKSVLSAAKVIFDVAPPMKVFEFLVEQHMENLESRREFHQNRLLFYLDQTSSQFTAEEASAIRSSIQYSRIPILDSNARKEARNAWKKFGDERSVEIAKECSGFANATELKFGACFKVVDHEIRNGLVKFNFLSKRSSLAYDYDSPSRVRNGRLGWFALKLGLKFVPASWIVKKGVSKWMNSHYREQRKSEGYVYEAARLQGQDALASWIAIGSANPVLKAK